MTGKLAHIARCFDLQESDIAGALGEREATRALLTHLATIAAPDTGAAKALLVVARMATRVCDWIDGDLIVDLVGAGGATRLEIATDLGGGLKERVFPPLVFVAPLTEFARAIDRVPHMITPLRRSAASSDRISLSATEAVRRNSIVPPIEIAIDSLFVPPTQPNSPDDTAPLPLPVVAAQPPPAPSQPPSAIPPAPDDPPPFDVDAGWDD